MGLFFLVWVRWGFIQHGALWTSWICGSQLHNCYTVWYCSTILDALFYFFFFSLFSSPLFQSGELLLIYLQFQWFSPWLFQVYWLACQRYSSSLLLYTLFLPLLFIYIVSISQLKLTIWCCILFSTRIFSFVLCFPLQKIPFPEFLT